MDPVLRDQVIRLGDDGHAPMAIALLVGDGVSPQQVSNLLAYVRKRRAANELYRKPAKTISPRPRVGTPSPVPEAKAEGAPGPVGPTIQRSSVRELVERGIPATQIAALHRLPYAEVKKAVDAYGRSRGTASHG